MTGDFNLHRVLRRARWGARLDHLWASAHRPICWVVGHPWVYKMDLRGGALCSRCPAYKPPVMLVRDK